MTKRLILALLLSCSPLWATTYYVDNCVTVGSDRNNGTSASTPWLTINKVNTSKFNPGDSILFESTCTWREQLTVPSSGSAGSPITFGAYGTGAQPIINGADLVTGWSPDTGSTYEAAVTWTPNEVLRSGVILTKEASTPTSDGEWYWASSVLYVCCGNPSGLTMEATHRNFAVWVNAQGYISLTGLAFVKANQSSLQFNTASNVAATNCSFTQSAFDGLDISSGSYNVIFSGGTVTGNGFMPGGNSDGIGIGNQGAASHDITIQFMDIYANGNSGAGNGIDVTGTDTSVYPYNITIKGNSITNNAFDGVFLIGCNTTSLQYNVIYGNGLNGVEMYAVQASPAIDASLYNNTIIGGGTLEGQAAVGFCAGSGTASLTVKNNVLGSTNPNAYGVFNWAPPSTTLVSDYNDVYSSLVAPFYESYIGTKTLAQWQSATGQDAHSISANPQFANAPAAQFWLTSGSPGIGAGLNLGSPYNIGLMPGSTWPTLVTTRPTNTPPEIGAFVYVPPVALNPPSNLLVLSVH